MRKLRLQVQMTVDGFIAGPNGEMDWVTFPWAADINAYVQALVDPIDTIVLGRNLAEGFIPHWAGVAADAENPEQDSGKKFTDTPKVVFSNTLTDAKTDWPNTVIAQNDLVKEITQLKKQEGGDIYACGGATFVSALIANDLVDEFQLFINPAAIGQGMPIFQRLNEKQDLTLIKSQAFENGIVVLHYERKRA